MKRSQARSDWQSQCRAAVGFEIPISFLTLGWGLFSTSRGWLHSFAGGLLPPSSKLAICQVPESWILLTLRSLWPPAPLLPHLPSNTLGMEKVILVITQITWTCYLSLFTCGPLNTCKVFLEVPQRARHMCSWDEYWLFSLLLLLLRVCVIALGPLNDPGLSVQFKVSWLVTLLLNSICRVPSQQYLGCVWVSNQEMGMLALHR